MDYDNISPIYDVSRAANLETVKILVKLIQASSDSLLLDLGCGTGNYTTALLQIAKNVIGIDLSKGMIEQARAKYPAIQFIHGDITSLPFDSEIFDGAFSIQVLHHIKKKEILLNEAHRVYIILVLLIILCEEFGNYLCKPTLLLHSKLLLYKKRYFYHFLYIFLLLLDVLPLQV